MLKFIVLRLNLKETIIHKNALHESSVQSYCFVAEEPVPGRKYRRIDKQKRPGARMHKIAGNPL
jgi:hypothetical protein